ncbi:hypothetical protein [uncultured Oscillibacter sp.]|jgi:transcriptional regulator with XRE-family HTH domain|uniref:hypothetical protein n=1 Tax=uncultured Oscillibacter sp. TaxID=876091 RepID=UPI002600C816|nr:hypothetical protein [uncultured Oscillibacter sp.]
MIIQSDQMKELIKRRKELKIPQEEISEIFGKKGRAWWSSKERQLENGTWHGLDISKDQMEKLNLLLNLTKENGLSEERGPMVFDESQIIKASFQEALERDSLFTKKMLNYICKASEDDLDRLRYALYNFIPQFFSYRDSPLTTLIVQIRDEFTRALQKKFSNDDALDNFILSSINKAKADSKDHIQKVEFAHSSKLESAEYISNFLTVKSSEVATRALKEELLQSFELSLNSAIRRCVHRHFE